MNEEELNNMENKYINEIINNRCFYAVKNGIEKLGLEGCLESIESITNPILRWKLRQAFGNILFKK